MYKQITRAGYEYQDLIAIQELFLFLDNPNLYENIYLEYDNDGEYEFLDDIVCQIKGTQKYKFIQVKFTVDNSKYFLDWNWLTHRKDKQKSLLQKWSSTCLKLIDENKLDKFIVATNRIPDEVIKKVIIDNKIDWDYLNQDIKDILRNQIGSEEKCKQFFNNCIFDINQENLETFDKKLFSIYSSKYSESLRDWCYFKDFVKEHSMISDERITYKNLTNIIKCRPPIPLNQEFNIPYNYVPPKKDFHKNFIKRIIYENDSCIVLTGSPGVGKSTYLSYLRKILKRIGFPIIRHHYYLSQKDKNNKRYQFWDIKNSLLEQIEQELNIHFDINDSLEDTLFKISETIREKPLVLIIDGLDHVWRDTGNIDVINELFNKLFPIPPNIKIIIGTQPVEDSKLPHKLKDIPREKWINLPYMSIDTISQYLKNDKRIIVLEHYGNNYYNDISIAFYKLTKGHPLHLIYSLEYALNINDRMLPYDIERYPKCPNNDIRNYYSELINKIDDTSKDILKIFVISGIDCWKKDSIQKCMQANNITDVHKYMDQIKHMFYFDGYFFNAFHESLYVYIKSLIQESDVPIYYKMIQNWLKLEDDTIYKDLYLPIINAKLKDYNDILNINRETVVNYIKKGYSIKIIEHFLKKAEQITFFDLMDYVKTFEIRYIKTRLINLLPFNTYESEIFSYLHNKLFPNSDNLQYLRNNINQLENNSTLVAISEYFNDIDSIRKIYNQLKINSQAISCSNYNENVINVLSNLKDIKHITHTLIKNDDKESLFILFNYLCLKHKTKDIRKFISVDNFNYLIITRLCNYAKEQNIDLSLWNLSNNHLAHPYLASFLFINFNINVKEVISLDSSIVKKRRNEDFEYYGECEDLKDYFHSIFFEELYLKLSNTNNKNRKVATYNGFENFVQRLIANAVLLANKISNKEPIDLKFLLSLWDEYDESMILNEVRFKRKYKITCSALTSIICDLIIILNLRDLSEDSFKAFYHFKHFNEITWYNHYINNNIQYLSNLAIRFYIKQKQDKLNNKLQYTQERTDEYIKLSLIAYKHNLLEESRLYFEKAIRMALGYCHHKDPILIDILDSLEYCIDSKLIDCKNLVIRLAKIIEILEHIIDSNATHFKRVLMRLLYKINKEYCIKYYKYLLLKEDWYCADEIFDEIVQNLNYIDKDEKIIVSTLTTNISSLEQKLSKDFINKHNRILGINEIQNKIEEKSINNHFIEDNEKYINIKEYPVDKVRDFLSQIDFSNRYYINDWIDFWFMKGFYDEILQQFDLIYKENFLRLNSDINWDKIFKISLDSEGKNEAYKWLCRIFIQNVCWESHYSSWEMTKERFLIFKDLYKEKWKNFIIDTSECKYSSDPKKDFVIGHSHLIYFLILMEQIELTEKFMNKIMSLLEEDMADLPIQELSWL